MKIKIVLPLAVAMGVASLAVASSKISDESYRLVRQLVSYKNSEIDHLVVMNQYSLDCANVSEQEFASKKCSDRLEAMKDADRSLQVKHDVLGHEIQNHIRQHKDEEWIFLGLMIDDREFSNLAH